MRIRKNARLVLGGGSSASSSSSSSSFLVCQLNRSPWDAIDAFSLLQVDGDDGFGLNANTTTYFVNSIPPSDGLPSGESMELSFEYVEKPPAAVPQPPKREREEDEIAGLEKDMNGWRFELSEPYPTPLPPPPLPQKVEPPPPPSGPKRRGRPRKPTSASAAAAAVATAPNPYEFYYYSGFGPQWGKRRGGHRSSSFATAAADAKINHDCEDTTATTTTTAFETPGSSSTTHMYMMSEDEEDCHRRSNNNSNGKMKMKCANNKDNGVDLLDSVADGEIDYIEDDDDDEDERELYGSGRRARKPIKARSLKSLM
ncbi:hypothetical protein Cgig2_002343 [Carnegiea gigantea]|uniref:Uncharacterized protein n=1 Tax=Carnegiea gigantea TaxID=171969 RepID=A0A9Q1JZ44_9CARY|nr:hypothetical protein Cgig2_002343 [Carnegiea gigantea]